MDRLRPHAAGEHVVDLLARHGGHREHLAVLRGVEPVVALRVVEHQRAFGAGDLDPGRAIVWIADGEIPAAADFITTVPLSIVMVENMTSCEPLTGCM